MLGKNTNTQRTFAQMCADIAFLFFILNFCQVCIWSFRPSQQLPVNLYDIQLCQGQSGCCPARNLLPLCPSSWDNLNSPRAKMSNPATRGPTHLHGSIQWSLKPCLVGSGVYLGLQPVASLGILSPLHRFSYGAPSKSCSFLTVLVGL